MRSVSRRVLRRPAPCAPHWAIGFAMVIDVSDSKRFRKVLALPLLFWGTFFFAGGIALYCGRESRVVYRWRMPRMNPELRMRLRVRGSTRICIEQAPHVYRNGLLLIPLLPSRGKYAHAQVVRVYVHLAGD